MRCRRCLREFLVAFSCKGRGLCPSCGAKRAPELGAFLMDEVVEDVGHAQWVFTIPKMLRVYFLRHRELRRPRPLSPVPAVAAADETAYRPHPTEKGSIASINGLVRFAAHVSAGVVDWGCPVPRRAVPGR